MTALSSWPQTSVFPVLLPDDEAGGLANNPDGAFVFRFYRHADVLHFVGGPASDAPTTEVTACLPLARDGEQPWGFPNGIDPEVFRAVLHEAALLQARQEDVQAWTAYLAAHPFWRIMQTMGAVADFVAWVQPSRPNPAVSVDVVYQAGQWFGGDTARPGQGLPMSRQHFLATARPAERPEWVWAASSTRNHSARCAAWDVEAGRYVRRVKGMEAPEGWAPGGAK